MPNRFQSVAVMLITCGGFTFSHAAEPAANPAGTFAWESDYGEGMVKQLLLLRCANNKVNGFYRNNDGNHRIKSGTYKENAFEFSLVIDRKGNPIDITCVGTVDGDELSAESKIKFKGETHDVEFDAKRETRIQDVLGKWKLSIEANDQTYTPEMEITKEGKQLAATYKSEHIDDIVVESISLKDNVLRFEITGQPQGEKLTVTYEGKPAGTRMTGTAKYAVAGVSGEGMFTGEKLPKKKAEKKNAELKKAG